MDKFQIMSDSNEKKMRELVFGNQFKRGEKQALVEDLIG